MFFFYRHRKPAIGTALINSIFVPFAILGLLRLVACLWLTKDFIYATCEDLQRTDARRNTPEQIQLAALNKLPLLNNSDAWAGEYYRPPSSLWSSLFRALFLLSILGLITLCLWYSIPILISASEFYTTTMFTLVISYTFFLVISTIV